MKNENFGLWKVIDGKRISRKGYDCFNCQCRCGTIRVVNIKNLKSGQSTNCGCLRIKDLKGRATHNKRGDRIWGVWQTMKSRCYNKNAMQFKDYGGRGITVCDEWKNSFISFYNDLGDAPVGKSLERINNSGNYEPSNVRWATRAEQTRNKRSNRKINGICISDISKGLGGADSLVNKRLKRGWSIKDAVSIKSNAHS